MRFKLPTILLMFGIMGCGADACSSCGYSRRNNEIVGQIKKVVETTPILCNDMQYVDISLGLMQNGTGSMSKEDMLLLVRSDEQLKFFKENVGKQVRVFYDERRMTWCPDHNDFVVKAELYYPNAVETPTEKAIPAKLPENVCIRVCGTPEP